MPLSTVEERPFKGRVRICISPVGFQPQWSFSVAAPVTLPPGLKPDEFRTLYAALKGRSSTGASLFRHSYLDGVNRIVLPDAAERRAASRISVTVTFVSSDENPSSFAPSRTTALKYESELS